MKKAIPKSIAPDRVLTQKQLASATGGLGSYKGPGGPPPPDPGG